VALILEWLFFMNIVVGLFNLAPGFPMDGGRVVRATLWGITGDYTRATRWATNAGRGVGYFLVGLGIVSVTGVFSFFDSFSGLWFIVLGLFLEQAARQSWLQSEGLRHLGEFRAADIMNRDIDTIDRFLKVRTLTAGPSPRRRFIYFVSGPNERVTGIVTEKEIDALDPVKRPFATAEEAMTPAENAAFAAPADNGARLLELMEAADVRHLPIVDDGLVVGVVSKENLLRLVGRGIVRRPKFARA
jgi:CBS domain-containing protein